MHPQKARSDRTRETSPLQSVRASETPIFLPGVLDARSRLQLPQDNLGKKPGVAYRVGKHSRGSLHRASFQAQKQAESFPDLDRIAPASEFKSLSDQTPLKHLASEEGTRQKLHPEHPPTQLWHAVLLLGAEMKTLQRLVRDLAQLTLGKVPNTLGAELAADDCRQNNNNNNTTTHNNNNNNNNNHDDNNDNDNNKNGRESGLNSLDLDNDNPKSSLSGSEPDLDETSLVSFNPAMGVESSLGSLDQQEADLSLENLGHQMMTIGSSLGSLDQKNGQEGMTIETAWDPSLDPSSDKKKKRVTFSKATLEAYDKRQQNNRQQPNKGSHPTSSQLQQLGRNTEKQDELPEKITKTQLPKLAGMSFSKSRRGSNRLQQL